MSRRRRYERGVRTSSAEQTRELGRRLGAAARPGDVMALVGPLGAGKTCLAQGLARGLGVEPRVAVASPTFSLVHEYPGRVWVYHVDLYRLERAEIEDLGLEEYLEGGGVSVVEWAERWPPLLDEATVLIELIPDADGRTLRIATDEARLAAAADGED